MTFVLSERVRRLYSNGLLLFTPLVYSLGVLPRLYFHIVFRDRFSTDITGCVEMCSHGLLPLCSVYSLGVMPLFYYYIV